MEKEKVKKSIAEEEVLAWLDYKKVSPKRREEKKDSIEKLIEYIQDGIISIDPETFVIKQNLLFQIEKSGIRELNWKPFGQVGKFQINMKGVDSTDFTGNCIAHACAQCDQSKSIINALDSEDAAVMKVIATFFI